MTYGVEATGANGQYIIDSTTSQTEFLGVVASGTSTINTAITTLQGDLVFARPHDSLSTLANRFVLWNRGSNDTSITFYQSRVDYVILRKTQDISGYASGQGDYGFQVNNANGTLIYDSRKQNSGVKIVGVHPPGSFGGNRAGFGQANSIPAATGNGYPGTTNRSNVITTSNVSTTYMSCDYGNISNNGYFSSNTLHYLNDQCFHGYYYTTSNIQWYSYMVVSTGFMDDFNMGLSNMSTVMRGILI